MCNDSKPSPSKYELLENSKRGNSVLASLLSLWLLQCLVFTCCRLSDLSQYVVSGETLWCPTPDVG